MTHSSETNAGLSTHELAEGMQTKADQQRLVWRYIWSTALIVATIGMASVAAHWTGLLG